MSSTLKNLAIIVLVAALAVCAVVLTVDTHRLLEKVDGAVTQLERSSTLVADYVEKQKGILESPRNQKALEAGWQTAAALNGTVKDINRLVIPRVMRAMDGLNAAVISFDQSAQALTSMIKNTDRNVNVELLPNLAETAKILGVSIDSLAKGVLVITEKGGISIEKINALLADPQWKVALSSVASTVAHVDAMAGNVAKASDSAPGIAAAIEKIAKTSSRYQKLLLLAQLLAAVARAF